MPFAKGKSGNPKGQSRDKDWAEQLRVVAKEKAGPEKKLRLRLVAEKVFEAAMAGDMQAAKEIGDRIDGKAAQSIEAGGTLTIRIVE